MIKPPCKGWLVRIGIDNKIIPVESKEGEVASDLLDRHVNSALSKKPVLK
jgi:hypothetical protein